MNTQEKLDDLVRIAQMSHDREKAKQEQALKEALAKGISNRSFLWSRALLEIANGDVQLAKQWIMEKDTQFGSYHENASAWVSIQHQLDHGQLEEGLERACMLWEFISQRGDAKSLALLMPLINAAIKGAMARLFPQPQPALSVGVATGLK